MIVVTEYRKLLPEGIPGWQRPHWDGLREHKLLVQQCANCQTLRHIPKEICPKCYSTEFGWQQLSGHGLVFTYTSVHRAPTPAYQSEAPYVIIHAQMDEGVRLIANLVGTPDDAVAIGMSVEAVFDDVTPEWTLLRFQPRGQAS
jgi:uncharacterized protein